MESSAIRAYEILKRHDFSAEEAEIIIASKDESLSKWVASKDDVYAVKEDLANVKLELKEDIAALDMKIASVRTELKEDIATIREGIVRMEARLETSLAKAQNSTNRWLIGAAIALFAALSSIIIAVR
jgi:hypothetical protein